MMYRVNVTLATKVKSVDDYKQRIGEIFNWQIRKTLGLRVDMIKLIFSFEPGTLLDMVTTLLLSAFYLALIVITLPFVLICVVISLVEALWTTIVLPLYLIPVIRFFPLIVSAVLYGAYIAFGVIGGAALTDDIC